MLKSILLATLLIIFGSSPIHAIVNPLDYPNNSFGIHIIDENDLDIAASLVNSNGGQWGYVTLVIREDDRNLAKWQTIFDRIRKLKLIPLVRLATRPEDSNWIKPRVEDIAPWVDFLNQLNWVVQNRYVILFNEPNHAKEWGGQIDPAGYTDIVTAFHTHLKAASPDFFILPAGIDLSADGNGGTMHPATFFQTMFETNPNIFRLFDGWTSHSYPNPNFSGSPLSTGRQSIQGYRWELNLTNQYGLDPNLPVFITETGWTHKEGKTNNNTLPDADQVAKNYHTAFTSVWKQKNIAAITPFVLNYQDEPFDHFSWQKFNSNEFYPQLQTTIAIPKTTARPAQVTSASLTEGYFPKSLISKSKYLVAQKFINTGQSIWEPANTTLKITSTLGDSIWADPIDTVEPFEQAKIWLNIQAPQQAGIHTVSMSLQKDGQTFGPTITKTLLIKPDTDFSTRLKLWIEGILHNQDFSTLTKSFWNNLLAKRHRQVPLSPT